MTAEQRKTYHRKVRRVTVDIVDLVLVSGVILLMAEGLRSSFQVEELAMRGFRLRHLLDFWAELLDGVPRNWALLT